MPMAGHTDETESRRCKSSDYIKANAARKRQELERQPAERMKHFFDLGCKRGSVSARCYFLCILGSRRSGVTILIQAQSNLLSVGGVVFRCEGGLYQGWNNTRGGICFAHENMHEGNAEAPIVDTYRGGIKPNPARDSWMFGASVRD
jgi:hypothetical protein